MYWQTLFKENTLQYLKKWNRSCLLKGEMLVKKYVNLNRKNDKGKKVLISLLIPMQCIPILCSLYTYFCFLYQYPLWHMRVFCCDTSKYFSVIWIGIRKYLWREVSTLANLAFLIVNIQQKPLHIWKQYFACSYNLYCFNFSLECI